MARIVQRKKMDWKSYEKNTTVINVDGISI